MLQFKLAYEKLVLEIFVLNIINSVILKFGRSILSWRHLRQGVPWLLLQYELWQMKTTLFFYARLDISKEDNYCLLIQIINSLKKKNISEKVKRVKLGYRLKTKTLWQNEITQF